MKEAKDMKDGREYKKLGEVAFYPTKRISSEMVNENNYVGVDNLIKDRGGKVVANFFPAEGNVIEYLKGDVLLGNIRPYLKKIWLSDTKGGASGDVLIIRANDTKHLYPNYLYWALASDQFFEYDNLHCKGAKMPRGNKIDIMQYLLPIPTIEEQQQIVSELDLLSEVIEKHKAQLEELDKLAQSIFYDMFGDPVTNEKGWEVKKIKDICKVITGNTPSRNNLEYYNEEYIEWIKTDNILRDSLYPSLAKEYLSEEGAKQGRIADVGSILIACIAGSLESISKCCLLNRKVSFNQQINALVPKEDMNSLFVYSLVNAIADYIRENTTNGMKHIITKSVLEEIRICVPPLSLQQDFAAKVEAIEAMKAKVRQSLKEAETLFNERMDYYFN